MHDHRASALPSDGIPVTRIPDKGQEAFDLALRDARRLDIASAAGNLVKSLVLFYSMPEHQAFLAGAFIGAAASHRMRPVPGFIFTFVCGLAAEKAYLLASGIRADLHAVAVAQGGSGGPDPAQP